MAYTKRNQDGGAAPTRGDELLKRDKEAAEIRRQKADARRAAAKSGNGSSVPPVSQNHTAPKARGSLTRTVQLGPSRSQIEQILGSDADTLKRLGARLCTAIDKVAAKRKWDMAMVADAYNYAIKLVHGNGDVDPDKLNKQMRRVVEQRFATTVWFMRAELAERKIYPYGTRQPFFTKDYESAKQYCNA